MFKTSTLLLTAFILVAVTDSVLVAQIFAPAVNYIVGLRPYTIISEDFENDGDFDLFTASNVAFSSDGIGWVKVLINNGNGSFTPRDSMLVGDGPALEAADLDTNGHIDLVVSDFYTNRIYILMYDNTRSGPFYVSDSFASGRGNYTNSLEPCAVDLDADGDYDLAVPIWVAGTATDSVSVFFNNGNATFSGPVVYPVGNNPYKVISGDLDNDGDSDLVVTNNGSASVSVMLNNGNGTLAPQVNYTVGSNPQGLSLAYFDGDTCLDLAVANSAPGTPYVSVLMGNCDGTFDTRVDYPGCRPHAIASADYDRDGDIDMAVPNNECNSVSIFLNNSNGTFAPHFQLQAGTGTSHIVTKDFDGDGDPDLAVENFDNDGTPGNTVSVFINQTITSAADGSAFPRIYSLEQNYPNPFNPSTKIKYSIPQSSQVTLKVFDALGNEVAVLVNEEKSIGTYEINWIAKNIPSGVYFYQIRAGTFVKTNKMILMK